MLRKFLSIAILCVAPTLALAQAVVQSKCAHIVVVLPAETSVFIDGFQSQATGLERRFVSPALEPGISYTYTLKFVRQGKELIRPVRVRSGELTTVVVKSEEFQNTPVVTAQPPATAEQPAIKTAAPPPARSGFVLKFAEERWWVFKEGSKDLAEAQKHGVPEKHITRLNIAPWKLTLKAPDLATLEEYLTAKPGYVTKFEDGRLWVFRSGSKELGQYIKDGELAKQVVRPGAGPRGLTLKAPDNETILGYVTAYEGFETFIEDGRVWVFRTGAKELELFKKHGELEKHVVRINAGPLRMTVKAPDAATIDAYQKAFRPQ